MGGRRNHWVTGRLPRRVSAPPWEPSRMAPRESKREQERRAWVARREGFKDESEAYEQRLARQRPVIRLEMGGPTRRSRPLKGAAWATVISSQVQPRPGWSWEGRRAGGRNLVETGAPPQKPLSSRSEHRSMLHNQGSLYNKKPYSLKLNDDSCWQTAMD